MKSVKERISNISYTVIIIIFCAVIIFASILDFKDTFSSCVSNNSSDSLYEEGYDEGYALGESYGYEDGYEDGFEEGYESAELDYFSKIEEYDSLENDYNKILQITLTDLFSRNNKRITENTLCFFDCVELKYSTTSTEYEKQLHYTLTLNNLNLKDFYTEHTATSDTNWNYWEFSENFPLSYYGVFYKDNNEFKIIRNSIYGKNYFAMSEDNYSYISDNELKDYIIIKENINELYVVGCVNSKIYGVTLELS